MRSAVSMTGTQYLSTTTSVTSVRVDSKKIIELTTQISIMSIFLSTQNSLFFIVVVAVVNFVSVDILLG